MCTRRRPVIRRGRPSRAGASQDFRNAAGTDGHRCRLLAGRESLSVIFSFAQLTRLRGNNDCCTKRAARVRRSRGITMLDRRRILAAALAAAAGSLCDVLPRLASASVHAGAIAPLPPLDGPSPPCSLPPMPQPRHEVRPPRPPGSHRWRWSRGRWRWNGHRWVWVSGHWSAR